MHKDTLLMPHNAEIYEQLVEQYKETNDILLIHGTGMGKSFLLIELLNKLFADYKILYLVPKLAIKDNFINYEAYKNSELDIDFKTYNYFNNNNKVQNAYKEYDFFVFDEAHHMGSNLYGNNTRDLLEMIKKSDNKKALGLTATNKREDKIDVADYFSSTVLGVSIFKGIENGLIPPFEYLVCGNDAVDQLGVGEKITDYRQVIEYETALPLLSETIKRNPKNKWICYFTNIEELELYEEMIEKMFPKEYHILKISSRHSTEVTEVFNYDKVVIMSVDKLLEGVHLPNIEGIILFRKVGSLPVFQQILGRLVRVGYKEAPLILDCTETAFRMLGKLISREKEKTEHSSSNNKSYVKKIMYCNIQNIKHFDLQNLLLEFEQTQKIFEYDGLIYKDVKECCEKLGLNYYTVCKYRSRNNVTHQEAIDFYLNTDIKEFKYNGIIYTDEKECCDKLGFNYSKVTTYKNKNRISYQEAIDYYYNKQFFYNEKPYKSIIDCCKKLGINERNVFNYKKNHKTSYQEAIDQFNSIEYNGIIYNNLKECCDQLGLNYNSVCIYKTKNKIPLQNIIDAYINDYINDISQKEYCEKLGLNYYTVCKYRSRNNVTYQEAVNYYLNKEDLIYNNIKYDSAKQMCEMLKLNYDIVRSYKNKHKISYQEAIDYYLNKKTFKYGNNIYKNAKECCNKLKLNYERICDYKKYHHITFQEAIDHYLTQTEV